MAEELQAVFGSTLLTLVRRREQASIDSAANSLAPAFGASHALAIVKHEVLAREPWFVLLSLDRSTTIDYGTFEGEANRAIAQGIWVRETPARRLQPALNGFGIEIKVFWAGVYCEDGGNGGQSPHDAASGGAASDLADSTTRTVLSCTFGTFRG